MHRMLSLGISPCPNDTYIFEALVHGRINTPYTFSLHMADVEELNTLALSGALDVTKLSLAAVPLVLNHYILLGAGGALGRGCGPLVVSNRQLSPEEMRVAPVAIPGNMTTANSLLTLTNQFSGPRREMRFDAVIPAVLSGETDLGVIIHEGRFTYAEHGLQLVLDLGKWWEETTGLPLPLGVIAVKRSLGEQAALHVENAIRSSLNYGWEFPDESMPFVREHAQEMKLSVMQCHIETFVNAFSMNLGVEGRESIRRFLQASAQAGGITLPGLPLFAGE